MIYFVRHGETDYNKQGKLQGQLDIPLNEKGREQAETARDNLKDTKIGRIICSPLKRAFETAQIINEKYHLEIEPDDRLKEICGGDMQGRVISDLPKQLHIEYHKDPTKFGGESLSKFCERVFSLMKEIENLDENILIVSHAGVYRAIYKYINNLEGFEFKLDAPKNSEIIRIK